MRRTYQDLTDNSPKFFGGFYGVGSDHAMIGYAISAKNYSINGHQRSSTAGILRANNKRAANGCPFDDYSNKFI
ncbi:hypothetical protein [Yersinia alsatica]|uniref:hypothetical protein n=1 Tax=Yersinia alsatica TaxID=2890317 RepID=UPI0011A4AD18|nr:hypothetical protein [Yersinia alsatica]